ncbi:MAG: choice-of-anchor tandem repeat GloVer-containing protein [Tepidisphaeraceae bacterium]
MMSARPRTYAIRAVLEPLEQRILMTLSTLVSFNGWGIGTNGEHPQGSLITDSAGNLYGTADWGGASGDGTVFEISADAHTLTTLASFNGTNGAGPSSNLVIDSSGNLYGTCSGGGANGYGTVFEVSAGTHTLTTLINFNDANGAWPDTGLTIDSSGNLYGTTDGGGTEDSGTVFEISAGTHTLTTLVSFDNTGEIGLDPYGALILDSSGNLYGTTYDGGAHGEGAVFEISASSHIFTTLVNFNGTDGNNANSALTLDSSGNLYGTCTGGGTDGYGTIFEISAGTHDLTTLFNFSGTDGDSPNGLIFDGAGNLFGTTYDGGANNDGTIFELAANTHAFSTLVDFDGTDGSTSNAALTIDTAGNLYGTTYWGGANDLGEVFELTGDAVGASSKLAIAQQPANVVTGQAISPSITVDVQDTNGNLVALDNSTVTLAVATGPGSAAGTLTATAVE